MGMELEGYRLKEVYSVYSDIEYMPQKKVLWWWSDMREYSIMGKDTAEEWLCRQATPRYHTVCCKEKKDD